jgi:hypothetical protein
MSATWAVVKGCRLHGQRKRWVGGWLGWRGANGERGKGGLEDLVLLGFGPRRIWGFFLS